MLGGVLLCLLTLCFYSVSGQGECTDHRGRLVGHGLHYVPGPDTCTLCVCDNGQPKVCKAVLCSPPQDCRSFRVGSTCCEFICLDDVVKPAEGAEANVRVAAGGAAAVVLLTVALVVYRVRKQKRRRPRLNDDQRSLTSIGYISGSMGYMGGTCETALAAWKPPGNYLPRGEAPPPYDEAVRQCRQDNASRAANEPTFHRTYPATVETLARPEDPMQYPGHGYANMPRPIQQMANPQGCYNAPLLQPVHPPEPREPISMPHHPLASNMVGFPSAIRLTGSLGAISNRGLLSVLRGSPEPERPHNVPGFYTNTASMHTSLHRTIPRISTAIDTTLLDSTMVGFSRDRSLHGEIRRSFHKPGHAGHAGHAGHVDARHVDTGRSMPRNLNLVAAGTPPSPSPHARTAHTSNIRVSASGVNTSPAPTGSNTGSNAGGAPPSARAEPEGADSPAPPAVPPATTLPLTVDKPSCVCSYEGSAGGEDGDDYRSECENCKATSNSRWAVSSRWPAEQEAGTQTLQRLPPPPAPPPPPHTATLPQPVTRPRNIMGPPSNWENWFNTIPDSDTESEEE